MRHLGRGRANCVVSENIDQATKLREEHKYYEANLALKAIDDSLSVDSVSLTELAKKHS